MNDISSSTSCRFQASHESLQVLDRHLSGDIGCHRHTPWSGHLALIPQHMLTFPTHPLESSPFVRDTLTLPAIGSVTLHSPSLCVGRRSRASFTVDIWNGNFGGGDPVRLRARSAWPVADTRRCAEAAAVRDTNISPATTTRKLGVRAAACRPPVVALGAFDHPGCGRFRPSERACLEGGGGPSGRLVVSDTVK